MFGPMNSGARKPTAPTPAVLRDAEDWGRAGIEPTVEELLDDGLTHMVMRRDGLRRQDVLAVIAAARCALTMPERRRPALFSRFPAPQGAASIKARAAQPVCPAPQVRVSNSGGALMSSCP